MLLFARIFSLFLLLSTNALHAQWLHFGVDGIFGVHGNTLDARFYKAPVGNAGLGAYLIFSDPLDPMRTYFKGRLSFEADIETRTISGNNKQDFNFRDLISSFQVHQQLNEKLSVYAAINFSVNMINSAQIRQGGTIFTGERSPVLEAEIRSRVRKINAGVEAGFVYPLTGGLSTGLHVSYYLLKRLQNDLVQGAPGTDNDVALNFRPLALKWLLAYTFN